MNVRTLCLASLYEGETTGYEIRRQCVEGNCAYFIEASYGSIYPALAKLEQEGLVTSRAETQRGKPAKKIYSITEAGREAFSQELQQPLGEDVFRSPFLLFARFAHIMPRALVAERAQEFLRNAAEERKLMEELLAKPDCNATDKWVIQYGRAMMAMSEEHARNHIDELITLAQPDDKREAAE